MKKIIVIDGPDACCMMHTALRKCCDSTITSAVYNMIHLVDVKPTKFCPWHLFGELVADQIVAGYSPVDAIHNAYSKWKDKFDDIYMAAKNKSEPVPDNVFNWFYSLYCSMGCFSESDWIGMSSFLSKE